MAEETCPWHVLLGHSSSLAQVSPAEIAHKLKNARVALGANCETTLTVMQLTDIRDALSKPDSTPQLWAQAFSALLQLLRASGSDVGLVRSPQLIRRSAVE